MLETRRHSVDLPISKTLVALRRVRSLRDPMTNSMNKFSALVDNMSWEISSCNDSSVHANAFENRGDEFSRINRFGFRTFDSGGRKQKPDYDPMVNGFCSSESVEQPNDVKLCEEAMEFVPTKSKNVEVGNLGSATTEQRERSPGLIDELGFSGSSRKIQQEETVFLNRRSKNGKMVKSSKAVEDTDTISCSYAQEFDKNVCGISDIQIDGQSHGASLFQNDGVDAMGSSYRGGEISCFGSRTPKFGDGLFPHLCRCSPTFGRVHLSKKKWCISNSRNKKASHFDLASRSSSNARSPSTALPSDTEVLPLLTAGGVGAAHSRAHKSCGYFRSPSRYLFEDLYENDNSGHSGSCRHDPTLAPGGREMALYSDGPLNLSQKFRPRSFDELVGQNMVVKSLENAVLKGKIAPIYLFQGPCGTGKTSAARIFTAALNCLSLEGHRPCGLCQECTLVFSGRSRYVKQVDAAKANCLERINSLLKHGSLSPVSSRFKVFIVDECHLFRGETWAAILNSIDDLPRHVVFIMTTTDPDKLPRAAVSRCQKFHFSKIKEADIAGRLNIICVKENLDCDEAALGYISVKSNGSLRDAETMLEQLSLLGQRITVSLIYELVGSVSEDELLDLLDLALSADTSSTVRKARELMRSRVDPMALVSQLANLIMDILAGRCQFRNSKFGRSFFGQNVSNELELQKLRHALKVLSETEKQLKTSKNQSTWLTAALLQFSASSSLFNPNDLSVCQDTTELRENRFCSTSLPMEALKHPVNGVSDGNKLYWLEPHNDTAGKLNAIWRTVGNCQSHGLKNLLLKEGKLSSICVHKGLATVELEFTHPDHASKAEKSWKNIATSFQHVLGCNIEIRINLVSSCASTKNIKVKKSSLNLSCLRRMQANIFSTTGDGNAEEHDSVYHSKGTRERTESGEAHFICGCRFFPFTRQSDNHVHKAVCFHTEDRTGTATRNIERNAQSTATTISQGTLNDDPPINTELEIGSSKEVGNSEFRYLGLLESENQPSCFSKTISLQRWLRPSDVAHRISLRIQARNKHDLSIPRKTSLERVVSTDDPYILFSSSNQQASRRDSLEDREMKVTIVLEEPEINDPEVHSPDHDPIYEPLDDYLTGACDIVEGAWEDDALVHAVRRILAASKIMQNSEAKTEVEMLGSTQIPVQEGLATEEEATVETVSAARSDPTLRHSKGSLTRGRTQHES